MLRVQFWRSQLDKTVILASSVWAMIIFFLRFVSVIDSVMSLREGNLNIDGS